MTVDGAGKGAGGTYGAGEGWIAVTTPVSTVSCFTLISTPPFVYLIGRAHCYRPRRVSTAALIAALHVLSSYIARVHQTSLFRVGKKPI